jgi:hypothetical protein
MIRLKSLLSEQWGPKSANAKDTRYKSDAEIAAEKKAKLEKAKRDLEKAEAKRKQLEKDKAEADRLEKERLEKELEKQKADELKKQKEKERLEKEIETERDIWRKQKEDELKKKKELEDKKKKELEDKKKKELEDKKKKEEKTSLDDIKIYQNGKTYKSAGSGRLTLQENVFYPPDNGKTKKQSMLFYAELQEKFPNDNWSITSGFRSEYHQSRVMYQRYKRNGYDYNSSIGDIYSRANNDIKKSMQRAFDQGRKISDKLAIRNGKLVLDYYRSKGRHISRHQFGGAVDVTPKSAKINSWINSGKSKTARRCILENRPAHTHVVLRNIPETFPQDPTFDPPKEHPFPPK